MHPRQALARVLEDLFVEQREGPEEGEWMLLADLPDDELKPGRQLLLLAQEMGWEVEVEDRRVRVTCPSSVQAFAAYVACQWYVLLADGDFHEVSMVQKEAWEHVRRCSGQSSATQGGGRGGAALGGSAGCSGTGDGR